MMANDGHYMLDEVGTSSYLYHSMDYHYLEIIFNNMQQTTYSVTLTR